MPSRSARGAPAGLPFQSPGWANTQAAPLVWGRVQRRHSPTPCPPVPLPPALSSERPSRDMVCFCFSQDSAVQSPRFCSQLPGTMEEAPRWTPTTSVSADTTHRQGEAREHAARASRLGNARARPDSSRAPAPTPMSWQHPAQNPGHSASVGPWPVHPSSWAQDTEEQPGLSKLSVKSSSGS